MNARAFELNVSLPADTRFAETMRALAAHAARYAGCRGGDADLYGAAVETVVQTCLTRAASGAAAPDAATSGVTVPVILRRGAGAVEFLIACEHRFDADAAQNAHIKVGWTCEAGSQMCRVVLNV